MHISALYHEFSYHLDNLFTVFVTYTNPISYSLQAAKFMNFVTFREFCEDIGVDEYLASYLFLVCSRYEKTISDQIAGPTFKDHCKYCYEIMLSDQS